MFENALSLFPVDSAAITISTTVWLGVVVAVMFNLRLGWNLSAMVVPGYVVPLLISRPATAVVILVESVVTYLIARIISDGLNRTDNWSSFFGRDRFFVIVLVSVIVRAAFDGWLLPEAGQYIVEELKWNFDYRNELQSFGLIVVALIANYFWKPGLGHGTLPLFVTIFCTYLAVLSASWITNLNLENFHLIYEDISISLLASPKSYVILITTAFLASWINLRYAWDFNGILIPALLGLTLFEPSKIFATVTECMLIYSFGSLLLRAPIIRDIAMQGGRKLLFFFSVCFGLRLVLSHLTPLFWPGFDVSDSFGLGYLLSTLMAVKAHDKKLMVRMLKGTLQVSLVGGITGSLIGFCLLSVGSHLQQIPAIALTQNSQTVEASESQQSLAEIVRVSKPLLYEKHEAGSYRPPLFNDLVVFRAALKDLSALEPGYSTADLAPVASKLARVNYGLTNLSGKRVFIKENAPAHGWGMYMVNPSEKNGICFEVPTPLEEASTLESSLALVRKFPASGLAIAGARMSTNIDGSADVTQNKNTMFAVFHQIFGQRQTVQVRAMTGRLNRTLQNTAEVVRANIRSQLFVKSKLPSDLSLETLKEVVGPFAMQWRDSPFANRVSASQGYVELALNRPVRERLMLASLVQSKTMQNRLVSASTEVDSTSSVGENALNGTAEKILGGISVEHASLQAFVNETKSSILKMGSELFVPATLEDMLFMDNEVVAPLIDIMGKIQHDGGRDYGKSRLTWLTRQIRLRLNAIHSAAAIQGYQIRIIVDDVTGEQVVALCEKGDGQGNLKGWGTFLFRPSLSDSIGVEIPRPLFENRSFDFGVKLFKRPRASVLLVAGAHPRANRDGAADISKTANRRNLFNLVRQVLFRKFGDRPFLICQARAIQAPVDFDIVIASDQGNTKRERLSPLKKELVEHLQKDSFSVGYVDGSFHTAGYELGIMMKAAAIQVSQNKEVVSLWLSPSLRNKFRQQTADNALSAQMSVCGIPSVETRLVNYIDHNYGTSQSDLEETVPGIPINAQLKRDLSQYVSNFDVLCLLKVTQDYPNWKFTHVIDPLSGQAFLLIARKRNALAAVMNLNGRLGTDPMTNANFGHQSIDRFIASHKLWLEVQ